MADIIYLSIWLHNFSETNMMQLWQRVIETFPASAVFPGVRSVTIYPFNWAETPVFERSFGEGISAEEAVSLASEFLHEDYAYEAEMIWDLWARTDAAEAAGDGQPSEQGDVISAWRAAPASVLLACLGPQFESEAPEDRADIQIRFGLDTPFLPPDGDAIAEDDLDFDPDEAEVRTRENLQQLVGFVHRLDEVLPLKKRVLWCDSGENLAEKILRAVTRDE